MNSLLDNDLYAILMSQVIWRWFSDWPVRYGFRNRSVSVRLSEYLDLSELQSRLDAIRALRFTETELQWLRQSFPLTDGYIDFLRSLRMPEVEVEDRNGWLNIEYESDWPSAVLWETPVLYTVNDLYFEHLRAEDGSSLGSVRLEADRRLTAKIEVMREHPSLRTVEYGTRRRYAPWTQELALERLYAEIPDQMLGTSNMYLARKFGLPCKGTNAHQLQMVLAAKFLADGHTADPLAAAEKKVTDLWRSAYGENRNMLIFLPDTFGTDHFLRNLDPLDADEFWGFRQDSGDPIAEGEKYLAFYAKNGISPEEHCIGFSDSLDVNRMLSIDYHFAGRVPYWFGVGTNLTNDCGYEPISIVVKPLSVFGCPTVKLSNDLSKAQGSRGAVARYKELAGYGRS